MNFGGRHARRAAALRRRWHATASANAEGSRLRPAPPSNRPPSGSGRPDLRFSWDRPRFRRFAAAAGGGKDDDDLEEWIPPDHSPLVANRASLEVPLSSLSSSSSSPGGGAPQYTTIESPEALPDGEIEVIDLEATLENPANQQFLKDQEGASAADGSEYKVEASTADWKELLKELKDSGEHDMLNQVVKEYGLQDHLASLEDDDAGPKERDPGIGKVSEITPSEGGKEGEEDDQEWDEIFEQSLQGLSQEEVVDALIDNSMALSQMEMEILSDEMDRSERGEKGGLDPDSLDDLDWNDNAAYREFRAMVLEDYLEKKRSRAGATEGGIAQISAASPEKTTNFAKKSDLADYPADWKDYDSNAAFRRDFSEDDDSWVPPSSDFIPSHSYSEEGNEDGSDETEPNDGDASKNDLDNKIDWLQARRSRLGDDFSKQKPTHMLTPEEAQTFRHQNSQIPIVPFTLLTTSEISTSLDAQGGTDIRIIDTSDFQSELGVGCSFIMLITGRNPSHIRVLADSIVRNLKARKLAERGVIGAMRGAEGGQDIFSNKRSRNRASRHGGVSTTGKIDDDWMVVDCDNIHVHIIEETTRQHLNIEGLWDLSNPDSEGSKLRKVNLTDEESVDAYVSENPIPDELAARLFNEGGGGRSGNWFTGGVDGRVQAVPAIQRTVSFSETWRPKQKKKKRGKR